MLIKSYVGYVDRRKTLRTVPNQTILDKLNILRVFLLGDIPQNDDYIKQTSIETEHRQFNDVIQGLILTLYSITKKIIE